jgi:chromosome segregation ATPase
VKRSAIGAAGIGIVTLIAAARLAATPAPGLILGGTGETSLQHEQAALKAARIQSEQARERSERLEQQASAARDEADQARRRAAAMAARIQQAEADIQAAQARIAIKPRDLQQSRSLSCA